MSSIPVPFILIAGQGRSGTNWLLELLDLCDNTWCRNEPNELVGSAMAGLEDGTLIDSNAYPDVSDWVEDVSKTAGSFGDRDQIGGLDKNYYRNLFSRQVLRLVYNKPRVRRPISYLFPHLRREEWAIPRYLLDENQAKRSVTIIKVNQMPAWSCFVLGRDSSGKVIHIVRHPGGFLNSWMNRYVKHRCQDAVLLENRNRLTNLAESSEVWSARMGDIYRMSLPETELWYWLYANEETYLKGADNTRYKLVVYERLATDFDAEVEKILDFSSLKIAPGNMGRLSELGKNSSSIADGWKNSLAETEISLIRKVLSNSELSSLWSNG